MSRDQTTPCWSKIIIYRFLSPSQFISKIYDHIVQLLESATCLCDEIILTGDFNIDILSTTNANCKLIKICRDAGLKQIIDTATREYKGTATLLDHLYTTHENRITELLVPVYGLSDHYPICFTHKSGRGKHRKHHHEKIEYRNFKNFSQQKFVDDLHTVPWSVIDLFSDVDDKIETWNTLFTDVVNKHIPLVTRRVKNKQLPGWMTRDILQQICVRDKLKARAKNNVLARTMYKRVRNNVVKLISNSKSNYFKEKILENKSNTRNLWKLLKQTAPIKASSKTPTAIKVNEEHLTDPVKIADAFNEYFTSLNVTSGPPEGLVTTQYELDALLHSFVESRTQDEVEFCIPPITREIIEKDLKRIPPNKATGLDGISIRVLKEALPVIIPSLAHMYNASISQGVFPATFKKAKVTPLHKKDSKDERSNYRPISVLPILSKPLERHVASAYLHYLTTNKLLYKNQSAYRPYHSCETALLNTADKWLKAMDNSELVGTVLLDLSKAFDLVNHDILIAKLSKYHTSTTALNWFTSYLSNRRQVCSVSGVLSSTAILNKGVPQGSILGPLLFSVYMNDLPFLLKETEVDIYADDTTIWSSGSNSTEIEQTLDNSLRKANSWFKLNEMKPNAKKTKHLLIGTVQKLLHSHKTTMELSIDDAKLEESVGEKLLGVVIDSHLSWNLHIDYLIRKVNSRICLLKRAKTYLTVECRKMLYNALIKPVLEYCCTVWGNCSVENLERLLRLQKRCARLILDATINDSSVKLFDKLGWLPIDDTIRIRKLLMLHKVSQGHCPEYFSSYFQHVRSTHRYHTRSAINNNIQTPLCKRNSGLRTFHSSACRLWNNLDNTFRDITSHSSFRKRLQKKHLNDNRSLEHFKITRTF